MDDPISRQAAIEAVLKLDASHRVSWKDAVIDTLDALSSAEPRWVPMTERLPKPYQQCWFTTTDGEVEQHHFDGLVSRYKAWMPFEKPEPWKGEADE